MSGLDAEYDSTHTSNTDLAFENSVSERDKRAWTRRSMGGSSGIRSFAACSGVAINGSATAKPRIAHAGFVNTFPMVSMDC
jgi:hypothetical protein